jgi:GTP cyclohydrolase I
VNIEFSIRQMILELGEDPEREGLRETPERVMRALHEMTSGYRDEPKAILDCTFTEPYDEMVVVSGIEFWSLCEHHMLPFHGRATVGYVPDRQIVGLSKLPRLVHCFARRLQVQERLTKQIAEAINEHLNPKGVGVVLEATHLCMAARGVRSASTMSTSCLLGCMRDDASARAEFLHLANGRA